MRYLTTAFLAAAMVLAPAMADAKPFGGSSFRSSSFSSSYSRPSFSRPSYSYSAPRVTYSAPVYRPAPTFRTPIYRAPIVVARPAYRAPVVVRRPYYRSYYHPIVVAHPVYVGGGYNPTIYPTNTVRVCHWNWFLWVLPYRSCHLEVIR